MEWLEMKSWTNEKESAPTKVSDYIGEAESLHTISNHLTSFILGVVVD